VAAIAVPTEQPQEIMKMRLTAMTALATAFTLGTAGAEPLKRGDTIPDVTVQTVEGKTLQLKKLVAEKPTVLIFYRGGWCPFCTKHLSALVEIQDDLKTAGVQMLAISIDQPSKLKQTPDYDKLGYKLLSDADAKAAEAFGLVFTVPDDLVAKYKDEYKIDLEAASGRTHHKLPHPAVYVVSPGGTIEFDYVNQDYKVRLEPQKILEAAQDAAK
jgi:peroxiredoxin